MRLHPSITYQLPRVVQEGGLHVNDHFLPAGSTCGISPGAMNRSQDIFGADANDWKPERWLALSEDDSQRIRHMDSNLTTVGMDGRNCVGRNLAMVSITKYVTQFLRHFDVALVNAEQPWVTRSQWFALQSDLWVILNTRQ